MFSNCISVPWRWPWFSSWQQQQQGDRLQPSAYQHGPHRAPYKHPAASALLLRGPSRVTIWGNFLGLMGDLLQIATHNRRPLLQDICATVVLTSCNSRSTVGESRTAVAVAKNSHEYRANIELSAKKNIHASATYANVSWVPNQWDCKYKRGVKFA